MESLLVNLRKYRPRENTDPLENFVTEAFAWLLKSSVEVSGSVLKLINTKLKIPLNIPDHNVVISTQENFGGKFPDMVMRWGDVVVVFEHKVWAELHENQLDNYRNYIKDNSVDYRLVLITASTRQHAQKPDAAFCWEEIYENLHALNEGIHNNEKLSWCIDDFLALLKSEGLGPSTPINPLAILYYPQAIALESQLNALIDRSKVYKWSANESYILETPKKSYGRLGFELNYKSSIYNSDWLPGIFFGFMLDGSDHLANDLMGNGLKAVVILDMNEEVQQCYLDSDNYKNLIQEIFSKRNEKEFYGWTISDRTTEKNVVLNKWHPLIISMPMNDFFHGSTTLDEQINVFHEKLSCVVDAIMDSENFILLQKELLNHIDK